VTRENWDEGSELSSPFPASIIYESLPDGASEITQVASEDEHKSSVTEVQAEKCMEQKEGAMSSLPTVLKGQQSKPQETSQSVSKGEVANCIQESTQKTECPGHLSRK
jgi:hypothetical protein